MASFVHQKRSGQRVPEGWGQGVTMAAAVTDLCRTLAKEGAVSTCGVSVRVWVGGAGLVSRPREISPRARARKPKKKSECLCFCWFYER